MDDSEKAAGNQTELEAAFETSSEGIVPIDTLHDDEATTILKNYTGIKTWLEHEERLVRRKIDIRLLPVLCATYGLQVSRSSAN